MTTYLTRSVHFSAAHRYFRPEWSEERNREIFGACANPWGHGHNYTLEVTVAGNPDPQTGFCVDLGSLDRLLETHVRRVVDHQHLNHVVPGFAEGGAIPTTENLAIWAWRQIAGRLTDARLVRIRLREEPGLWVDYFGEGEEGERWPPRAGVEV